MIVFVTLYLLGLVGFFIHLYRTPIKKRTKSEALRLLLLYQIVFGIGLTSFVGFIGLTFEDTLAANMLSWPKSPFEQELANVNLAFGVLGVLAIWHTLDFWKAVVIGFAIWIFSDGIHHLWDVYYHQNPSAGNLGFLMYTDLLVPLVIVITLVLYLREQKYKKPNF